jgi:hypothetical protein
LDVAVPAVGGLDGQQGLDPLLAGLAEADQQAGGERDAGLAGRLQRGQPPGRRLVGSLVIMPCDGETARSRSRSALSSAPALAWGSSPVSVSTAPAAATR